MITPRINGVVARRPPPLTDAFDGDKIIVFPADLVARGTRSVVNEVLEARRLRREPHQRALDWLAIGAVFVGLLSFWAMILLAVLR